MNLEERAKATAKNIEGKLQEAVGNATGNERDQVAGKAKQTEASIRQSKEDVKDALRRTIDRI